MRSCRPRHRWWTSGFVIPLMLLSTATADEDTSSSSGERIFSSGFRFVEMSGEELFVNVCQGCHMPDASGATGAASYPSLAADPKLEAGGYPVYLVIHGRRAMPPFGEMMSDDQIAAVVNYLRTHFGNDYRDIVTPADVRAERQ